MFSADFLMHYIFHSIPDLKLLQPAAYLILPADGVLQKKHFLPNS